jgi:hypothetical protein
MNVISGFSEINGNEDVWSVHFGGQGGFEELAYKIIKNRKSKLWRWPGKLKNQRRANVAN